LILYSFPIGEFDFLVRALSGERGLLTLKLRGARRPRARLRFLKEPGIFADLHLYGKPEQAKPVQMLTGTILESFEGARENFENFHAAADVLKFARDFSTAFDSRSQEKLCLTLETLARLALGPSPAYAVIAYKLKMLEMSGWKLSSSELALTGFDPAAVALCERLEQGGRPLGHEAGLAAKLERMLALHAERLLEGKNLRSGIKEAAYA